MRASVGMTTTKMNFDYLYSAEVGRSVIQKWVQGNNPATARKAFWASLTDEQKDASESIECIDERPHLPTMKLIVHILGTTRAALANESISHNLTIDIPDYTFSYESPAETFILAADDVFGLCNNPSREGELLGLTGSNQRLRSFSVNDVVELPVTDCESKYLVCVSFGWQPCSAAQFAALREAGCDGARARLRREWEPTPAASADEPLPQAKPSSTSGIQA